MGRCVIIAGGELKDYISLKMNIRSDDFVICADSGYKHAKNADINPSMLIGDFDSYKDALPVNIERIVLPTHKDDTDTHFASKYALEKGFKDFLLCGVWGSRPDHSIASLYTLKYLNDNGAKAEIFGDNFNIYIITNGELKLRKPQDRYTSIFTFNGDACGVTLTGFEYPLNNATLKMSVPNGVSNRIVKDTATITVESGTLILMTVNDNL